MGSEEISKAWKDEEYRESLNDEQRAQVPESPIGEVELSEEELDVAGAGKQTTPVTIAITTVISGAVTAASVAECASILSGGTCHLDTGGCC